MGKEHCCSHSLLPHLLFGALWMRRIKCFIRICAFQAWRRSARFQLAPILFFPLATLENYIMLFCRGEIVTYEFEPGATMLRKAWRILLMFALHTVCIHGATIPVPIVLPLNNEHELSNITMNSLSGPIDSGLGPAKPDLNATKVFPNVTAGQNDFSWTQFVAIGIQRTQSLFPGTLPISINTSSCDAFDYPHWEYLDCYTIAFSGPTSTYSASIKGRWHQHKAHIPYWEVPLRSQGTQSSLPVVPWPPFVTLEAAEELARSMGHTQSYHTVTLEGVQGSRESFYYKFISREVQPWHFSFHDVTLERVGNGSDEVTGS